MTYAHDIIRKPIISERSMEPVFDKSGKQINKYTFEVAVDANTIEIKKAVEEIFGVQVADVNTMRVMGKMKRMGRYEGRRASWKKAIVTLKPESKTIEFFEM